MVETIVNPKPGIVWEKIDEEEYQVKIGRNINEETGSEKFDIYIQRKDKLLFKTIKKITEKNTVSTFFVYRRTEKPNELSLVGYFREGIIKKVYRVEKIVAPASKLICYIIKTT